ncbi:MAG: hypothetical protein EBU49_01795 [Proteobacteria bacterium]|nr:hypothetical protein [Pseudomonadota bacterium]
MERTGDGMVVAVSNFDVVIVGGGLAGLLHADMLADDPSTDLRVAIIDPDPDSMASKTFASWRLKSSLPHRYSNCVENRWARFRVTSCAGERIVREFGDYCYERIPGERLRDTIRLRLDADSRFQFVRDSVVEITEGTEPASAVQTARVVGASGRVFSASRVLSSVTVGKPEVLQYFLGFEVETGSDHFDPDVVDLMDFRVAQKGDVRFVYVLPFSRRHALVEFLSARLSFATISATT